MPIAAERSTTQCWPRRKQEDKRQKNVLRQRSVCLTSPWGEKDVRKRDVKTSLPPSTHREPPSDEPSLIRVSDSDQQTHITPSRRNRDETARERVLSAFKMGMGDSYLQKKSNLKKCGLQPGVSPLAIQNKYGIPEKDWWTQLGSGAPDWISHSSRGCKNMAAKEVALWLEHDCYWDTQTERQGSTALRT